MKLKLDAEDIKRHAIIQIERLASADSKTARYIISSLYEELREIPEIHDEKERNRVLSVLKEISARWKSTIAVMSEDAQKCAKQEIDSFSGFLETYFSQ